MQQIKNKENYLTGEDGKQKTFFPPPLEVLKSPQNTVL